MRTSLFTIIAACLIAALAACSSIDCPLNNRVYAKFRLGATLDDTLTVAVPRSADNQGDDTILINRMTNVDSIMLPMSYSRAEDVYVFDVRQKDTDVETIDTVWVAKSSQPHFESVDCNPAFFHTITDVRFTTHAIENIQINNDKATYNDAKAHFIIDFKSRDN